MRFRGLMRLLAALALVVFSVVPSIAATTLSGTVMNYSSKQLGRVYVALEGWPRGSGVSIAAPGNFTIRGVQDGWYQLKAFMDSNNDGAFSVTEAAGQSYVSISGGQVIDGSTAVALYEPQFAMPQAASSLRIDPGSGAVLVSWPYPRNMYGAIAAESFDVEWSSNGFATVAGSLPAGPLVTEDGAEEGNIFVTGLTNGATYSFRVKSKIGSQVALSQPVSAQVGTPAGGYTVSGTITFNGVTSTGKPLYIGVWSDDDEKFYFARYPSPSNGMTFSIPGVPNGLRGFYAFIDQNLNHVPDAGDYLISQYIHVNVNGANISGVTIPLTGNEISIVGVSTTHIVNETNQHQYFIRSEMAGFRKRPINCYATGPQLGIMDLNIFDEVAMTVPLRPNVGDTYTFTVTFSDGSAKSFSKQVSAVYDTPPGNISPSGNISTSPATISWLPPAGFPATGYAMANIWGNGNDNGFNWESEEVRSSMTSLPYDGSPIPNGQYTLMVQLCDINWNCIAKNTNFSLAPGTAAPGSITVPANDPDGNYTVTWGASTTPGTSYVLEESTSSSFTPATYINAGYNLGVNLSGRAPGTTFYYRVRATAPGYGPSYRAATNPCKVSPAVPASITVPTTDPDGSYTVSWAPSAGTGVGYTLEEATNSTFTAGLRVAYTGTGTSAAITGRTAAVTYYYRVKANKTGYLSSAYRTAVNGCLIGATLPLAAVPASITVPAADADGIYSVSWGASATAGASYLLQEATNPSFTANLRTAYTGAALSAAITGRSQNVTYFYRVVAIKAGMLNSAFREGARGCAVPGTATAATPASIAVPVADSDGSYTVTWGASATAGVYYKLEEATNSTFTAGLRTAYAGAAFSAAITGRSQNVTYFYRVLAFKAGMLNSAYRSAVNGCAVPGTATVAIPASIVVPVADADGIYSVAWGASATAGVTYLLQEATNSAFTTGLRTAYTGTALSSAITGRLQNVTYFYRVMAVKPGMKNSAYRTAVNGCAVPGIATVATPASIVVPVADADGIYTVAWGASATAGVTYLLQEATNSAFTTGLRTAYTGTALSSAITGRLQNVTYFYRVMAVKPGMKNSAYRTAVNGCAVPGTATVATPASLTVPASDADGSYSVSWGASATAGVTYQLQEATNATFTTGLRTAYVGTALSSVITGRSLNYTYYYRVIATKPGLKNSYYRGSGNGCAVPGTATVAAPASIVVPLADADGIYTVSWGASATAGVGYLLQEATDSTFTTNSRTLYVGSVLSFAVTGRLQNSTYYYRVMATKPGLKDSAYRTAVNGCAVPGTVTVAAATPGALTVPVSDADGSYSVSWGASATAGVTYLLQEATNPTFTAGLRTAYTGTALSAAITGRLQNFTYYYRVIASKPGLNNSAYRTAVNGCEIPTALSHTAWFMGNTDPSARDAVILVLLDNGRYLMAQNGVTEPGVGQSGMEHGTYSWNTATGAFTTNAVVDTNGSWGFSHTPGATASVSGNTLTFTVPGEGTFAFTRLARTTHPLVGTWSSGNPNATAHDAVAIFFLSSTRYMMIQNGVAEPGIGQSGMEHGTYSWNQTTGVFSATAVVDTNGEWGASHLASPTTLTVSGNTFSTTIPGEGTYTSTRLY